MNAATPPQTACWWVAVDAGQEEQARRRTRRFGPSGLPAETDYPLKDLLEDLAEDAEDAVEDLSVDESRR